MKRFFVFIAIASLLTSCSASFWGGFLEGAASSLYPYGSYNPYSSYSSSSSSSSSRSNSSSLEKSLEVEDDGFRWYETSTRVSGKRKYGAQDTEGRTLISAKYDLLYYDEDDKIFRVHSGDSYGIYSTTGKNIIPTTRGYTSILNYTNNEDFSHYAVFKGDYEGVCDENGKEIISPNRNYTSIFCRKHNNDNSIYFKVKKGDQTGILNENGVTVIPTSRGYTAIYDYSESTHFPHYQIAKGEFEGICALDGREIISPTLGFTDIYSWYFNEGPYCYARTETKAYAIFDKYGNEILSHLKGYNKAHLFKDDLAGHYFLVGTGDYTGILDSKQQTVISPNKYTSIGLHYTNGKFWYHVKTKNGYLGVCDATGAEKIRPTMYKSKVDSLDYEIVFNKQRNRFVYRQVKDTTKMTVLNYSLRYFSDKQLNFGVLPEPRPREEQTASTTHQSTTRQSSSHATSNESMLLELGPCQGCGGSGRAMCGGCQGTGSTYMGNTCVLCNGTGYQACIVCNGTGQTLNYGGANHNGHTHNHVPQNTIAPSSNTSSNNGTSHQSRTPKTCGLCEGKGWIAETKGVASFGDEKWCSECNKTVPANHYHVTCPSCKGAGEW